jgi:NAD(P)-dependent dehydrogenase (short-subunit alcohol dehydrogenase family)
MQIEGAVVAVTGGGGGIGAGLCRGFAAAGARAVAVADIDENAARAVADEIRAAHHVATFGMRVDVGVEADVRAFVERTEAEHGRIDLFCANAGVGLGRGLAESNDDWRRSWEINVMHHV